MWAPDLEEQDGPVFRQVLAGIERAVASGDLAPGARLPPQRMLAHRLGVSVGAVTRAYTEAERKGLVRGHVGRGTYVLDTEPPLGTFSLAVPDGGLIDLARNRPPSVAAPYMGEAFARLARMPGLAVMADYAPPGGDEEHKAVIGRWLADISGAPTDDARRLVLCIGAQQAMMVAMAAVCRPGDVVFCEAATFQGMKAVADHAGYRLHGLPMDEEGLLPDALDQALARGEGRVVYILPTLQNPTARSMGRARREAIVEVCRRRDAWIVEDDVYGAFAAGRSQASPLARLAPERTLFITGASKVLAPGLRVGAVTLPTAALYERALRAVRAASYAPPTFGAAIMVQWVRDGAADQIWKSLYDEAAARCGMALQILGEAVAPPGEAASLHLWLPMGELEAERTAGRALRAGVELTPPMAPTAPGCPVGGLRLCLGPPADRRSLAEALQVVRAALTDEVGDASGM